MHLREVQMENFKSFGRKLTVPFEPGYTAITGPNGSGKSNIGDAILFVLGPNTPRALRAGRLSDLIFNGGEQGKAADHCQVSLVFDNADRTMPVEADTVTLTRKVKLAPSKEDPDGYNSYFYVNGRASQKREFVSLLQHARISADGYNITLQGDVTHICNMTPAERRTILDDIAGITTFDKDIATADARKADVQGNLERIAIVLEEIGRNLAQLEKEKGAAVRYRELVEATKRLKGLMALRRRDDLAAQIAGVQQQVEQFAKERAKLDGDLATLRARYAEGEARFAEVQQKIRAEGGEDVAKLQADLEKARADMVRLEEKINFAKSELGSHQEKAAPLEEEVRKAAKELEKNRKVQAEMAKEAEAASKQLEARKKELDQARDLASRSDSGAMAINRELAQLKVDHEKAQLELHETKLEGDRLAERRRAVEKAIADGTTQRDATAVDLEETAAAFREAREHTGGAGKKRREQEKELLELSKQQASLSKDAHDLENRIRTLARERAELQAAQDAADRQAGGHGRAVDEVLKLREKGTVKGIVGTVTELVKVPAKYQNAMAIAAAGRLNAVIVEDDGVAAQCIEHVKKLAVGRVTLMPLSKMVPSRPSGQALMKVKQDGCLGFAVDLMEFNPRYQNAMFHVFGDTLVADTMTNGRRMMGGVRIVTLDGELFEKSGAMTGGKAGKDEKNPQFTNADRGRMDAILQEMAGVETAQQSTIERINKVRTAIVELQSQLAAEGAGAASHEDRVKELEARQQRLKEQKVQLDDELARLAKEEAQLGREAAKAAARVTELTESLAAMEVARQEKGKLLLKGTSKDLKERIEGLDNQVRELTETLLKAENRRDVAAQTLGIVEARHKELTAALEATGSSHGKHSEDVKRFTAAYNKAKLELEALMKLERKAMTSLKGLQDAKDKEYVSLVDLKAKIDKVGDRIATHSGTLVTFKAKLPALEEQLGEALVEIKEFPVTVKPDEQVPAYDDLKRDLRNAEASLDRLGPVNQTALEQYEQHASRKAELDAEVERLKGQREELVKLVTEITQKKKAALMEVFVAINENFRAVYAQISLGGQAYMELENEEDPFQGGLILKAQPLGKKVTRLDALSGGEKSLTSMAFIFAIQRYDPSPFYYFDEVDQNLDAVNSELLSRMIKENAKLAQFIVVSLRKITLKEASHIYGVTQQVPGQSEIIANFDIDTLRDDSSQAPVGGHDGEDDEPGDNGGPDLPTAAPRKEKKAKKEKKAETTLQDTIKGMMAVEVKQ